MLIHICAMLQPLGLNSHPRETDNHSEGTSKSIWIECLPFLPHVRFFVTLRSPLKLRKMETETHRDEASSSRTYSFREMEVGFKPRTLCFPKSLWFPVPMLSLKGSTVVLGTYHWVHPGASPSIVCWYSRQTMEQGWMLLTLMSFSCLRVSVKPPRLPFKNLLIISSCVIS